MKNIQTRVNVDNQVINFVSTNKRKAVELQRLLPNYNIIQINKEITEIQGMSHQVITAKCIEAYKYLQQPVLVEDTNLSFDALSTTNQLPGPYIKYFVDNGLDILVKILEPFDKKTGVASCYIGYYDPSKNATPIIFNGQTKGTIVRPRGNFGFGYDSIFEVTIDKSKYTYSEMLSNFKDFYSDRGKAVKKLKDYLDLNF
jgi:inosine triphosphate pyrophosphatase